MRGSLGYGYVVPSLSEQSQFVLFASGTMCRAVLARGICLWFSWWSHGCMAWLFRPMECLVGGWPCPDKSCDARGSGCVLQPMWMNGMWLCTSQPRKERPGIALGESALWVHQPDRAVGMVHVMSIALLIALKLEHLPNTDWVFPEPRVLQYPVQDGSSLTWLFVCCAKCDLCSLYSEHYVDAWWWSGGGSIDGRGRKVSWKWNWTKPFWCSLQLLKVCGRIQLSRAQSNCRDCCRFILASRMQGGGSISNWNDFFLHWYVVSVWVLLVPWLQRAAVWIGFVVASNDECTTRQ